LHRLILDDLSPAESSGLDSHVQECPDCQRTLEQMTADSRLANARLSGSLGRSALLHIKAADRAWPAGAMPLDRNDWSSVTGEGSLEDDPFPEGQTGAQSLAGDRFGEFEILGVLGRGGMGVVYEARQQALDRVVALKVLGAGMLAEPDELRRFEREAEALAALDHPNIVPILAVGEFDGRRYFSMPLIACGSLTGQLEKYQSDPKAAALFLIDVAKAVQHAHQRGILHRDLKPANILIDEQGAPHVTDFGLAKWVGEATDLTPSGAIVGSPPYMAPEQASGSRHAITTLSDVYGLGAILYTMLTGRAPFQGDSLVQVIHRVLNDAPENPSRHNPKISRALERICLKCLEKEPKRRYSSAESLADDLQRWVDGRPVQARPVGPAVRLGYWCRRHPVQAVLGACLVLSIILGIRGLIWQSGRATHKGEIARRVNDFFFETILDALDPAESRANGNVTVGAIFDRAAGRVETRGRDWPEVDASERWIIGTVLLRVGEFEKAEHQLRSAHDTFLRMHSARHFGVRGTREGLARALTELGRFDEAEKFARMVYETAVKEDGPHSPSTLSALLTIAKWQQATGQLPAAEENLRKVLAEIDTQANPDERVALQCHTQLATLLRQSGRGKEADSLLRPVVATTAPRSAPRLPWSPPH
jgi:hypothetical protein